MINRSIHAIILDTIMKEPQITAYTLWRRLDDYNDGIRLRELDDIITELKCAGFLPMDFQLRGLKHCPICTDGHGRYWAFARRQDKIAHLKEHSQNTLPKFHKRREARERNRAAALDRRLSA